MRFRFILPYTKTALVVKNANCKTTAKDLVKMTKETDGKMSAATPLIETTTQRGSSHCSQNTWLSAWKRRRPFPSWAPNVKLCNRDGHSCISEDRHADSMKQPLETSNCRHQESLKWTKPPKHSFEYLSKLDNKNANISGWTSQSQIQTNSVENLEMGLQKYEKVGRNLFM